MGIDKPFYIVAIVLSFFAGLSEYEWYYIFICSAIMCFGFLLYKIQTHMIGVMFSRGVLKFLGVITFQVILYSAFTSPAYFLGWLFT